MSVAPPSLTVKPARRPVLPFHDFLNTTLVPHRLAEAAGFAPADPFADPGLAGRPSSLSGALPQQQLRHRGHGEHSGES